MTAVKCTVSEDFDNYSFTVLFNHVPEKENVIEKFNTILKALNYKDISDHWDAGEL